MSNAFSTTEGISAYFVLFSTLLALVLVLSRILHDHPRVSNVLSEAGMILLVGIVASSFVGLFAPSGVQSPDESAQNDDGGSYDDSVVQSLLSFSPEVFFVALLPPIIFNSGYHLRRELFFRHIIPISLFAVIGTLVSAVSITFILQMAKEFNLIGEFAPTFTELLTFGALISATDPVSTLAVFQEKRVDPHLFYLVFGESVLNDAVGLILFETFRQFVERDNGAGKVVIGMGEFIFGFLLNSVCSPLLGVVCGCAAALLFKHVDMRNHRSLELAVYVLIMYVPFLLAQLIKLSGIVTILITGMMARTYVVPNLSDETAENAEQIFRLFALLAETSIFLELGLSVFGMRGSLDAIFIGWAFLACLIGRALNVYPIAFLYNQRLQFEPKTESEILTDRRRQFGSTKSQDNQIEMTENMSGSSHHSGDDGAFRVMKEQANDDASLVSNSNHSITPRIRRDLKISWATSHMLCFSGLRGAVAYACVRSFPDTFGHRDSFVVTTMVIVLITVFVLGGSTSFVLTCLDIEMNVDEERYMDNWHQERTSATILLQVEDIIKRNVVRQETGMQSLSPSSAGSPSRSPRRMTVNNDDFAEEHHFHTMGPTLPSSPTRKHSLFDYGK